MAFQQKSGSLVACCNVLTWISRPITAPTLLFDRAEAVPDSLVCWYAEAVECPLFDDDKPHDDETALSYSAALAQCRTVDNVLDWGNTWML